MLDELALTIFIICVSIYIFLFIFTIMKKKSSQRNVVRLIYANWVEERLKDDSLLTAVQALRNFIMGNSTFISALFILLGLLIGFYSSEFFEDGQIVINSIEISSIQVSVNIFIIIFSLLNFILSLRFATRLSLLISGRPQQYSLGKIEGIKVTQKTFISAQNHWMLGVRGLFFLVATMLWLISSIFFIVASILITFYLIAFQDFWLVSKKK